MSDLYVLLLIAGMLAAFYAGHRTNRDMATVAEADADMASLSAEHYREELDRSVEIIRQLNAEKRAALLSLSECRCHDRVSRRKSLSVIGGDK